MRCKTAGWRWCGCASNGARGPQLLKSGKQMPFSGQGVLVACIVNVVVCADRSKERTMSRVFLSLNLSLNFVSLPAPQDKARSEPDGGKEKTAWRLLFDEKSLTGWKATNFGGE